MSNIDKLLALGAYSCGGDMIWKNKLMGTLRNGDLILTPEGRDVLSQDIEDAVVVSETKRSRKPKAADPSIESIEIDV